MGIEKDTLVEEKSEAMKRRWRARQGADIIYGLGMILSGAGSILLAVGKLRKHG